MKIAILSALIIGLFVAYRLFMRAAKRKYGPMFSDEHFEELYRVAAKMRTVAIERMGQPFKVGSLDGEPRLVLRSKRIAIIFTIEPKNDMYLHHLSFSDAGGHLAFAAGGRFLYVMLTALRTLDKLQSVAHSRFGRIHGAVLLTSEEQRAFAEQEPEAFDPRKLPQIKESASAWVFDTVRSGRLARSEEDMLQRLGYS